MNPKDVTMESVAGALGLGFDAMRHSLLLSKRNALIAGARAIELRSIGASKTLRQECGMNRDMLIRMATELDAEIEAMMGGKQ